MITPLYSENLAAKICYYSLLYFVVALPFQLVWFPPTLGIIGVMAGWFFSFRFKEKWQRLRSNLPALLSIALFLLALLGLTYSSNADEGSKDVVVKISLLLFPVSLGSLPHFKPKWIKNALLTFAVTTSLSALILLARATWLGWSEITHQDFVIYRMISVHYFSMYCSFAFFIFLYYLVREKFSKGALAASLMAMAVLLIAIMFSAARIQLLVLATSSFIFLGWIFARKGQWGKMLVFQMLFTLVLVAAALLIPGTKQRVVDTYHEWQAYQGESEIYQTNHRVFIWKDALKVIGENLWTGTGTGAANDALHDKLKDEDAQFWIGYTPYTLGDKVYNYHNSFLQHFATWGITGFALLLSLFAAPLFRKASFISYLFLWIFFVSILTESMLMRQAGTLFFASFYALLFCLKPVPDGRENQDLRKA